MATNFANASYQEVIDLHTEENTVSVIGLHTPCNERPQKMLSGFWDQFRQVKYNGCAISLVPAARLPADISQVGYEAGEAPIDPRDLLNPIMFHGCHGNDMGTILNQLYAGSTTAGGMVAQDYSDSMEFNIFRKEVVGSDFMDAMYYRALTDNTWKKAHPQKGFRKSGLHPMCYNIVSNIPLNNVVNSYNSNIPPSIKSLDYNSNRTVGVIGPTDTTNSAMYMDGVAGPLQEVNQSGAIVPEFPFSHNGMNLHTNKLVPLGWQDTRSRVLAKNDLDLITSQSEPYIGDPDGDAEVNRVAYKKLDKRTLIPKHFMGMIMLPPAYKAEQYYRLIINHNFSFRGFRGVSMQSEDVNDAGPVFNFN